MEETKNSQQTAGDNTATAAGALRMEEGADRDEDEGSEECRICRSSAQELLEAEATAGGGGGSGGGGCGCPLGCCRRRPQRPPLRRLRCACAGSVRHVCARCYRRYYVARGIRACEICRQPTGLEGEDGDSVYQRLASFVCSDEIRYLVYAVFILIAFAAIFVLFFVASAADERDSAAAASSKSSTSATPRPDGQRRTERAIFVSIALVNLGFALAYIGYSCWHHCRRRNSSGRRVDGLGALTMTQPTVQTMIVQQQPRAAPLPPPPPPPPPLSSPLPLPSAPLLTPQLTSRTQQLFSARTFSV